MEKYPIATHYGGLFNGTTFYVMSVTGGLASCRPVSWGEGLATHRLRVSNLELESEGDATSEEAERIVAQLA